MKKILAFSLVLLMVLCMTVSCGNASTDKNAMGGASPSDPESPSVENTDESISHAPDAEDYERKIIKTYNLTLETKNYEAARDSISDAASSLGGYISDSSEKDTVTAQGKKDRYATFTVRVPSQRVDEYVDVISENASVVSKRLSTEDITSAYYDLEAQLESLVEQEARIIKLMDEATNYNYLLELDDKLTSIRAQINNINKQIQIYDKSVALSYVYITLDEVVEYTEIVEKDPTFGERIASTFTGTFENFGIFCQEFFLFIIWALPSLIIAAVAVPAVIFSRRYYKKKKALKLEKNKNSTENKI